MEGQCRRMKYCVRCDAGYTLGLDSYMLYDPPGCFKEESEACQAQYFRVEFKEGMG